MLPDDNYDEDVTSLNNRLKYLRTLFKHYENRWKNEYLTELREFQRNHNKLPAKQLKIGDIVLISDDKLPRNRCRLGKVEELIKSKDGHIRACKLRVHSANRKLSYLKRHNLKSLVLTKRIDFITVFFCR